MGLVQIISSCCGGGGGACRAGAGGWMPGVAAAAWALAERDRWIGWTERDRAQRLNWVVANTRFLLFPWVRVNNLASSALSLLCRWRSEKEPKRRREGGG